jgi:hypothetical protein
MTDELEARLRRADPAAIGAAVRPADGPDAVILRRTIMDMDDQVLTSEGGRPSATPMPWWRRPLVLSAVGAAAAAAVVITVVAVNSGGTSATPAAPTTVSYSLQAPDIMQMCLPVADIEPVAGADALAGTVVSVDGEQVVLDVVRWYAGGDADRVELKGADQTVALDGVDFVVGEAYLVTAAEGVVQPCGVSGPATPELEQLYEEWYG